MATGSYRLEFTAMRLPDVLKDTVRAMLPWARQDHVRLEWAVDPRLPEYVLGDPNRVGQIVSNFCSNCECCLGWLTGLHQ